MSSNLSLHVLVHQPLAPWDSCITRGVEFTPRVTRAGRLGRDSRCSPVTVRAPLSNAQGPGAPSGSAASITASVHRQASTMQTPMITTSLRRGASLIRLAIRPGRPRKARRRSNLSPPLGPVSISPPRIWRPPVPGGEGRSTPGNSLFSGQEPQDPDPSSKGYARSE